MKNLARFLFLSSLLFLSFCLPVRTLAQRLPEPEMDHEAFDRIDVELLLKGLEARTFSEREKAERGLEKMLKASGYPLWHFLISVDTKGKGLAETRLRLGRVLKVLKFEHGNNFALKDWEGNPLPNVLCEVYTMTRSNYGFDRAHAKLLGRTISDGKGIVHVPDLTLQPDGAQADPATPKPVPSMGLVVYAPEYGTAGAEISSRKLEVFFPLVRDKSKPALRAARGVVVDENGRPVEGVAIKVKSLQIDGMGGYNVRGDTAVAFTDHKGRYRVCGWVYHIANKLVPIGTKFDLQFSGTSHFPLGITSSNDAPKKIVLQSGKSFHRFAIDDEKAQKSDRLTYVFYKSDNPSRTRVQLPESYVKDGGRLIPGTYTATFSDARGYSADYVPIQVDAASPELLTFRLPPAKTYQGSVYDGISGKPLSDAIVFASYGSKEGYLVDITDQQLADLASVPVEEMKDLSLIHI